MQAQGRTDVTSNHSKGTQVRALSRKPVPRDSAFHLLDQESAGLPERAGSKGLGLQLWGLCLNYDSAYAKSGQRQGSKWWTCQEDFICRSRQGGGSGCTDLAGAPIVESCGLTRGKRWVTCWSILVCSSSFPFRPISTTPGKPSVSFTSASVHFTVPATSVNI